MTNQTKLHNLIQTGLRENIDLAFKLAKSNNIKLDLSVYRKMFNFIKLYDSWQQTTNNDIDFIQSLYNINTLSYTGRFVEEMPSDIGIMTNLTKIDFGYCGLLTLPQSISKLKNLENLYLHGNPFNKFPTVILELENLKRLDLERTNINVIPRGITTLVKLEEFYVGNTPFHDKHTTAPDWLSEMNIKHTNWT